MNLQENIRRILREEFSEDKNLGYEIDLNIYSVENKTYHTTDYSYMTEFTKDKE